jgi:hypothetical protein
MFANNHFKLSGLSIAMEGTPSLGTDKASEDQAFKNLTELTTKIANSQNRQNATQNKQKPSKNHVRMFSGNAPSINTISEHFFEDSFNLCNPVYFNIVFKGLDFDDSKKMADLIPQFNDKFTVFLDTVEIHLLKEISRYNFFFVRL